MADKYQIMYIYKLAYVIRGQITTAITVLNGFGFELITLRLISRESTSAKKHRLSDRQFSFDDNLELDTLLLDAVFLRTIAELSEPGSELM